MTIFWISYGVLWVVLAVQSFAFLETIRQIGLLRKQIGPYQGASLVPTKIDMGAPVEDLSAVDASAERPVTWDDFLGREKLGLVLFLSTHCATCRDIAEDVAALARELEGDAEVVAIVEGPADEAQRFLAESGLPDELAAIDERATTSKALGIQWTPAALTIRRGKLGSAAVVNDIYQVDAFVSEELAKTERGLVAGVPT
jgi:thiol-disulfide isomerase/thioredoxin